MALQYHPDRNESSEAHQKFVEVIEAYEVLTGQRKPTARKGPKRKTKEEIIASKVAAAKQRWKQQQIEEEVKDQRYYEKVAFGWKWQLFKLATVYSCLFLIFLSVDVFSTGSHGTIPKNQLFFNPYSHFITEKSTDSHFYVSDQNFWEKEFWGKSRYSPVRANYSYLFQDLKSVSVIVQGEDRWSGLRHSSKMRKLSDFEEYELATFTSSDSMYGAFPFIHIVLLVPALLVLFKRPTLRFNVWRLVSIWIIFPFFLFLTFSNDRIFHLFRFFE